jgi:hypothetical protein
MLRAVIWVGLSWLAAGVLASAAVAQTSTAKDRDVLAAALSSQMRPCWHLTRETLEGTDLIVDSDVTLNKDGTVDKIRLLTSPHDSFGKAATEAAMTAVQKCQPFKLPPERFEEWKEISPLRFDPFGVDDRNRGTYDADAITRALIEDHH